MSSPSLLLVDTFAVETQILDSTSATVHAELGLDAVRERVGNDEKILRMLARYFLQDVPPLVEQIDSAIQALNSEMLSQLAHHLKGIAANLEATGVLQVAEQLEQCGQRADFVAAMTLLEPLRDHVSRVTVLLRREGLGVE